MLTLIEIAPGVDLQRDILDQIDFVPQIAEPLKTMDAKNWKAETKYHVTLLILGSLSAILGLAAWLVIRNWTLSTLDWMFCFLVYPVIFSWFLVVFYSFRHDFQDGTPQKEKL